MQLRETAVSTSGVNVVVTVPNKSLQKSLVNSLLPCEICTKELKKIRNAFKNNFFLIHEKCLHKICVSVKPSSKNLMNK